MMKLKDDLVNVIAFQRKELADLKKEDKILGQKIGNLSNADKEIRLEIAQVKYGLKVRVF